MKLTFAINDRKKAKQQKVIDVGKKSETPEPSAMQTQQRMMLYLLPLMIGFFAIKFPLPFPSTGACPRSSLSGSR